MTLDELSGLVIEAAIKVHKALGPGLLESAYEACLAYELRRMNVLVTTQAPLPVTYEEVRLDVGYRIDLLIENVLVVELKSVEAITGVHQAQLITSLKLSGMPLGLLLNFNVTQLKDGIVRKINTKVFQGGDVQIAAAR